MRTFQLLFTLGLAVASYTAKVPVGKPAEVAPSTEQKGEVQQYMEVEVIERPKPRQRSFPPSKCCSIGKRVALKQLSCSVDVHQVAKKNNGAHKRKMKFHGSEPAGKRNQKGLMRKVEKCAPLKDSASMFMKCCQVQTHYMKKVDRCRDLPTRKQQRQCRRGLKAEKPGRRMRPNRE
ncbi:Small G protein signaling modulator 3 [Branchiostoma belcheri]|nr:Small G protein signaling modulator 3 [Branchiostoma belcheri]